MEKFKILVCVFADEVLTIVVNPSTTITELLTRILHLANRDSDDHLLLFNGTNLLDSPTSTLRQFEIKNEDQVILTNKDSFNVHVDVGETGEVFEVGVETMESVIQIKTKLEGLTGIKVDDQALYYCFNHMGDDQQPLAGYGIFNRWDKRVRSRGEGEDDFLYIINLQPVGCTCVYSSAERRISELTSHFSDIENSVAIDPLQLRKPEDPVPDCTIVVDIVTPIGTILYRLKCHHTDTLSTVKTMIQDKVRSLDADNPLEYIEEGLYVLLYNRKLQENDSLTLEEHGINGNEVFNHRGFVVCPKREFTVTIALLLMEVPNEMEVHCVRVRCFDTVATLKTKIKEIGGIPRDKKIILSFEQRFLKNDESCLLEYGIAQYPHLDNERGYYLHTVPTCVVEAITSRGGLDPADT